MITAQVELLDFECNIAFETSCTSHACMRACPIHARSLNSSQGAVSLCDILMLFVICHIIIIIIITFAGNGRQPSDGVYARPKNPRSKP